MKNVSLSSHKFHIAKKQQDPKWPSSHLFYFNEDLSRIDVVEMFKVKYQNMNGNIYFISFSLLLSHFIKKNE